MIILNRNHDDRSSGLGLFDFDNQTPQTILSGHAITARWHLGPVTGRLIAEMVTGETPFLDPAAFAAERFGG